MACFDILYNVLFKERPPELIGDGVASRIKATMVKLVMSFSENVHTFEVKYHKLMMASSVTTEQSISLDKQLAGIVGELGTNLLE